MPLRIRVDDFPFTKEHEWISGQHSAEKFAEFDSIIPVKYLLGVIPYHASRFNVWPSSKAIPAMHGFWHSEERVNEFHGFTANDIESYIISGLDMIELGTGVRPSVYMPPHNSIDHATIVACKNAGIESITVGPGTAPFVPSICSHYGMKIIESTPRRFLYGRSDELMADEDLIDWLGLIGSSEFSSTLTLHWTWENNIGYDSLCSFMELLDGLLEDFQ